MAEATATEAAPTETGRVCALIPAAGRGVRFGSPENKVFAPLLGRPLLGWTLQAFADCKYVDDIILIGGESDLSRLREIGAAFGGGKVRGVVLGGTDRQASVRNGLAACSDAEYIIVHDGARPCVTPDLIEETLRYAHRRGGAATVALPVADSLVRESKPPVKHGELLIGSSGAQISRDGLWAIQTPQAFHASRFREAHQMATLIGFRGTDDTSIYQQVHKNDDALYLVLGSPENIKVTRPDDLMLVAAVLAGRLGITPPPAPPRSGEGSSETSELPPLSAKTGTETPLPFTELPSPVRGGAGGGVMPNLRIGYGYDVHSFAPASDNRTLYLGGVAFPEAERGLAGHSDADVLLHALCDALLGAAGMGDIGQLFPPSDNRHKNRASIEFLQEVAARLTADGWQVANVDMTVIAEAPKINPRVQEMKSEIGVVLNIGPSEVGIKATTSEGLGFVGRGEGIAAHATALLMRP